MIDPRTLLNKQSTQNTQTNSTKSTGMIDPRTLVKSPTQTSAAPTFKTVDEALEYAKNNNIKLANNNVEKAKQTENKNKLKYEVPKENVIELHEEDKRYYLENLQKFKTSARINENSYNLAKERYENAFEEEKEEALQALTRAEKRYNERLKDYNTALAYERLTKNKMELFRDNIIGNIAQGTANILNTANRNFDNNSNALKGIGVQNIDAQKLYEYSKNPNNPQTKIKATMSLIALANQNTESAKKLLEEISNGTFNGTVQDIENILNNVQIENYEENKLLKNTYNYMQNVNESAQNIGLNDVERMAYNATGVVAGQVPTMAMTMINPALGNYGIYANAGQSAFDEALNNGATYNQANTNAMLSGLAELGVEKLSGGLSNKLLGTKALINPSNLTGGITNKFVKGIVDTGLDVVGEGLEEVAVSAIQPLIDRITYNPNAQLATGEELWSSFTESILPTLLMQGIGATTNGINRYYNKQVEQIQNSNLPQEQKTDLINKTTEEKDKIMNEVENTQQPVQNITPQSPNTQIQPQTNEVIPQQTETQQNTNLVQNNTQIAKNTPNNVQISQNSVQNAQDLQKTGQNDANNNALFKQGLEKFKKRDYTPEDDLILLESAPEYFYNLGYDSKEKVVINMKKLEETMREPKGTFDDVNQHGITYDVVEQLPEAINNPLNIIKNPKFRDRFVLITSLTDQYGDIVIVPIEMNTKGRVIRVNTVYGKEFYDLKKAENIQSYMERNKDNIVYDIDNDIKKRSLMTSVHPRLQLPNVTDSSASINNIIQSNENYVNNQQTNFPTQVEQQQAQQELRGKLPNMKKPKLEDIAELTEEQAQLPTMSYKQRADKNTPYRRKFWDNVESSKIVSKDVKEQVNMTNYERKHNGEVLEKMKDRLDAEPMKVAREWFNKDIKKATEQDVALGAILLERYQAEGRIEEAVDVVEKLADMGTEAGRTVQMYSIFQRLTPEGMMMYQQRKLNSALETLTQKQTGKWVEQNKDKFKLTEDDATFITAKVQEAQNAPTERQKQIALAEIENRINDKLPPEAGQSVKAFRRIAMLFNPKTQVRNVVGNITVMPLNYVTDLVATGIDKAISKKTGVRTTALPNVKTIGKGFVKGASETIDDYRKGIRTAPTGSRYEIQNNAKSFNEDFSFNQDYMGPIKIINVTKNATSKVLNKLGVNKPIKSLNKKLNVIDRLLSTVLELGDRPFYEASYQNALEAQMKANNVTEPTQEMIDIASNVALSQTWQDNNNYTKAVLGIRNAMNCLNINGFGFGDLVIPFAKTPANLTKAMVEYSPAGLIPALINYNDMNKAISRGDMTPMQQKKFVTSVGKAVAGTMLYAIAGALVQGGAVTGSSDEDKDVANFEKNVLGIQPYSIRIGDKTFTYNWAQPLATPFAVMADTYKMSKENAKLSEILLNTLKVGVNQLAENSFLQGVQELLTSAYGEESLMDNLVGAVMDLPTQFTPTLLGQIATQFDTTKRQTFENGDTVGTMLNEVKNKIPGAKNTLAPQVNTFGEEIQNYGGDNNPFNVFLNPGNISSANATDTQKELYALYEVTKDKTIFPRQAPYSVSGGGEKVQLSSQDRAKYQKTSGEYVTENLGALFDSKFYKSLESDKKAQIVNKIVSDADTTSKDIWIDTKTTEELAELKNDLKEANIPLIDYYNAWIAQKGIEADKNWQGKSISGSKKKKQIQAIDNAVSNDLTKQQKEKLYGIFNVSGY